MLQINELLSARPESVMEEVILKYETPIGVETKQSDNNAERVHEIKYLQNHTTIVPL